MEYSALALWLSVQTAAWPVDGKAEAPKAAAREAPKEENPDRTPLRQSLNQHVPRRSTHDVS